MGVAVAGRQVGRWTLDEMAETLEALAVRSEAEAGELPAKRSTLLELADLARAAAAQLRRGELPAAWYAPLPRR
jgi:hypothetical protein